MRCAPDPSLAAIRRILFDLRIGQPVEILHAVLDGDIPSGRAWRPAVVIGLWRDTALDVEFPDGTCMALERAQEGRTWRRLPP